MPSITITLTMPPSLTLHRLCKALLTIGLRLSYSGDGVYHLTETDQ